MSSVDKSRDGRVLGKRALDTRERLLDALVAEIERCAGWRYLSLVRVADAAACSPATVYQNWKNAEDALFDLARRQLAAGVACPERHVSVLEQLAAWGSRDAGRLLAEIAKTTGPAGVESDSELESLGGSYA